jgi:hypothetical protein
MFGLRALGLYGQDQPRSGWKATGFAVLAAGFGLPAIGNPSDLVAAGLGDAGPQTFAKRLYHKRLTMDEVRLGKMTRIC